MTAHTSRYYQDFAPAGWGLSHRVRICAKPGHSVSLPVDIESYAANVPLSLWSLMNLVDTYNNLVLVPGLMVDLDLHPSVQQVGGLVLDKLVGAVITPGTIGSLVEGRP